MRKSLTRSSSILDCGRSGANRLRAPIRRRRTESFIIYDESSSPSADDPASLLIPRYKCYFSPDAWPDRLHNRCQSYDLVVRPRGSRQVILWKPTYKKIQPRANPPEAGSNRSINAIPAQKINLDNKTRFG